MFADQHGFEVRCDWGLPGLRAIAGGEEIPACGARMAVPPAAALSARSASARPGMVIIVLDVLSFTTCVNIAVERGAVVYPFRYGPSSTADPEGNEPLTVEAFAARHQAEIAGRRSDPQAKFSLSPSSCLRAHAGLRLVLLSPNGAQLTLAARAARPDAVVLAGCLRNARAVGRVACRLAAPCSPGAPSIPIAVVPAGERWQDGTTRFAIEDYLAAGAIIAHLEGRRRSPEAATAAAAFRALADGPGALVDVLQECASGRELRERGFAGDVRLAAELDSSAVVPWLNEGAFAAWPTAID